MTFTSWFLINGFLINKNTCVNSSISRSLAINISEPCALSSFYGHRCSIKDFIFLFFHSIVVETANTTRKWSWGLGVMEFSSVQASLSKTRPGRGGYLKFTDKARFEIGKHAYPKFKESTVRTFRDKYVLSLKSSNSVVSTKKITSLKRGRPLMLGQLDEKVKKFLIALRHKGGVVNTVVANATAKALLRKVTTNT